MVLLHVRFENFVKLERKLYDMIYRTILVVIFLVPSMSSIPIDNGLIGEPLIECGIEAITINCRTRNTFLGHVYIKGFYNDNQCRTDSERTNNQALIRVPLDSCGVRRLRSVNPAGLYHSVTVVVTFHPFFITKVDRAINVQCFYLESNKFVTQQIDVSMLSTESRVVDVSLPVCRYEVLNFEQSYGPYLAPVRFSRVGQPVLHKWLCETETVNVFCMTVHSCQVDDGLGKAVRLLDENGCAMDRYLLGNLEYPDDLSGQKESHVFKYADKTQVYFQCQITLSFKGSQPNCPRPLCEELTRGKRSSNSTSKIAGILDVSKVFTVLDMESDDGSPYTDHVTYCLSPMTFSVSLVTTILLLTATFVFLLCKKNVQRKKKFAC